MEEKRKNKKMMPGTNFKIISRVAVLLLLLFIPATWANVKESESRPMVSKSSEAGLTPGTIYLIPIGQVR